MKLIDVIRAGAVGGAVGVFCWVAACVIAAIIGANDWMAQNSYTLSNTLMATGALFGVVSAFAAARGSKSGDSPSKGT